MNKVYLYALIPTHEAQQTTLPPLKGFDEKSELHTIQLEEITAIVCKLEGEEYDEEMIEDKINNDLPWLQKKAFHHHKILTNLNEDYTVIPLKFCTIYNNADNLKEAISPQKDSLKQSFDRVTGNEEWNLKIYCDEDKLKDIISNESPAIEDKRQEIKTLPRGRQFFEKKKIDRLIEKELEKEQDQRCESVHERLSQQAIYSDIKKNLGKDVTGLKENMSWNSVYLLPDSSVNDFIKEVESIEKEINEAGLRIEATGPWPAYHFSSFS